MAQEATYFEHSRPEVRALVPEEARHVLDVGCGAGALGAALKEEREIEVCGLELFPDAAARARERIDTVVEANLDQLEDLPFEPGYFDAMICGDVLEHLHDPARLLGVLRPYLADDGALVCSIPNVGHWSVVLPLLTQDRWPYADAGLLDRTHVHFFTLAEARIMLRDCGFTLDSAAATHVSEPPPEMGHLIDFLAALGVEKDAAHLHLTAYQYLLVAHPTA